MAEFDGETPDHKRAAAKRAAAEAANRGEAPVDAKPARVTRQTTRVAEPVDEAAE